MDAQFINENQQKEEKEVSNKNNDNKKKDSEENDTPPKESLEQTSSTSKEEKDKKDKKDKKEISETNNSNISNKAPPNISESSSKIENSDKNPKNRENEKDKCLNEEELLKEIQSNNYKQFYFKYKFCDFRTGEDKPWKVGIISDIVEDKIIIEDMKKNKKIPFKIDDSSKVSYFRKYSELSEQNYYKKRDNKETILKKFLSLEQALKDDNIFKKEENAWDIYYLLHSKIYFGIDSVMKIEIEQNYYGNSSLKSDNEGCEESFRFILLVLNFISRYYKYLLDNKDEFSHYINNIINSKFLDLKVINKKYAFYSFFETTLDLLNKIFANSSNDYIYCFFISLYTL